QHFPRLATALGACYHQEEWPRVLHMGDLDGQHTDLHSHSTARIVEIARAPTALAACDFPGVTQFTPLLEQPIAFGPAQHEAQIHFQRLIEPLALGKATVPDVAYRSAPLSPTAREQLAGHNLSVSRVRPTGGPPLHQSHTGRARKTTNQQANPVQP